MSKRPAFLDVGDDDDRQRRIGNLLQRLNQTSPTSPASPDPLLPVGQQRSPGPVTHPTELLARVQAFLPAISASNEALARQKPEDIDIERGAEDEEQYIEMNLGLGVFEGRPRTGASPNTRSRSPSPCSESDASSSASSMSTDSESHESGSEGDSDDYSSDSDGLNASDSDTGSSVVDLKPVSSRAIRPLPRRLPPAKLEV